MTLWYIKGKTIQRFLCFPTLTCCHHKYEMARIWASRLVRGPYKHRPFQTGLARLRKGPSEVAADPARPVPDAPCRGIAGRAYLRPGATSIMAGKAIAPLVGQVDAIALHPQITAVFIGGVTNVLRRITRYPKVPTKGRP